MSPGPKKTRRDLLLAEPWRFDILALLRDLEQARPDLPPLGTAVTPEQEIALLQQDPFMAFPSANVVGVDWPEGQPPRISQRFMGYFGAMGPLPLALTHEAWRWQFQRQDPSFARFADLLGARFTQLLYRAWADVRPVVQVGRPQEDRFRIWFGALSGHRLTCTAPNAGDDESRVLLTLAGLISARVRSAARLRQMLRVWLGLPLDLEERVASWLEFEPADRSRLGPRAGLGQGAFLGARTLSVSDKLRLVVHCRDLDDYEALLPGRPRFTRLSAFLERILGPTMAVDLRLTLPRSALPALTLGRSGQLGWTGFLAPAAGEAADDPSARVICATFAAAPWAEVPP